MTKPLSRRRGAIFATLAVRALLGAAVIAGLGYFPTRQLVGEEGIPAMLAGIAVALVGAWIGTAPMVYALAFPPQQQITGLMGGLGLRFGATIALGAVVWLSAGLAQKPLLLWIGMTQMVLIAIDVAGMVPLLKRSAEEAR